MTPDPYTLKLADLNKRARDLPVNRLREIVSIALNHPSGVDGYPASTGGQDGGRGSGTPDPTERAANSRAFGRRSSDPIKAIAKDVQHYTQQADMFLHLLTECVNRFDNLRKQDDELERGNDSWCWIVQQLGLPYDEAWTKGTHRSDLKGSLTEPRTVCRWVADWHRDRGVTPTKEQCLEYLERSMVRVHEKRKGQAA